MIMVPNLKTALAKGFIFLSLITTLNDVSTKDQFHLKNKSFGVMVVNNKSEWSFWKLPLIVLNYWTSCWKQQINIYFIPTSYYVYTRIYTQDTFMKESVTKYSPQLPATFNYKPE